MQLVPLVHAVQLEPLVRAFAAPPVRAVQLVQRATLESAVRLVQRATLVLAVLRVQLVLEV